MLTYQTAVHVSNASNGTVSPHSFAFDMFELERELKILLSYRILSNTNIKSIQSFFANQSFSFANGLKK